MSKVATYQYQFLSMLTKDYFSRSEVNNSYLTGFSRSESKVSHNSDNTLHFSLLPPKSSIFVWGITTCENSSLFGAHYTCYLPGKGGPKFGSLRM